MATKRLLRGQFDILTILVITTAVATTCALARWPLQHDVKTLAIASELSVFLFWAQWYYGSLPTHFLMALRLLAWSLSLGLMAYAYYRFAAIGVRMNLMMLMALFGSMLLPTIMLLRQIYKIYKMNSRREHDTNQAEPGASQELNTPKMNLGRPLLISALTVIAVLAIRVGSAYRLRGFYEFSSSDLQFGILLLVVMAAPSIAKAIRSRELNGR